jgi:ABC-type lipoprotein release transport system permease subunit
MGWLMAVLVYLGFELLINHFLAPRLNIEGNLCYLLTEHFFWALGLTIVTAIFASILGGLRASAIEPSDGLRNL